MIIDRIDIIHVKNPFLHPFETSFTRFVERDALIIKVFSEGLSAMESAKHFTGLCITLRTTALAFTSSKTLLHQ